MERGIAWVGEWVIFCSGLMYFFFVAHVSFLVSVCGIVGKFAWTKIHTHTFLSWPLNVQLDVT
jgi:hypothetical protein